MLAREADILLLRLRLGLAAVLSFPSGGGGSGLWLGSLVLFCSFFFAVAAVLASGVVPVLFLLFLIILLYEIKRKELMLSNYT